MAPKNIGKALMVAVMVLGMILVSPSLLQAADTADADPESDASNDAETSASSQNVGAASREGPLSKLQIHGFLTQAWATGNNQEGGFTPDVGRTAEEVALGIPEDGTFEYRALAIQFRFDISARDIMIFQLSSRELGISPVTIAEDEVELDWAFYERRLGDNTSLKIGRVQIPLGIYNEIRDVGTVLPFFRPSYTFYREGSFTSETVDGFLISHVFNAQSDWNLESNLYFGDWDAFEIDPFNEQIAPTKNRDSWGAWLWLNTSVPGLRWGLGFQRRNTTGGLEGVVRAPGVTTSFDDWQTSLEAAFDRYVFRAEYRRFKNERQFFPAIGAPLQGTFESWYAQVGFHPTEKFRIFLQWEEAPVKTTSPVYTEDQELNQRKDVGVALNYLLSPNVVFKVEYHEVSGEDQSFLPVFPGGEFRLQPIYSDLDNGDYSIISLSASF